MAKYHINPKTGEPSVCRAKIKCRFGDMQTEHYGSKEEAREAYERNNSFKNLYSMGVAKDKTKTAITGLNVFTVDDGKTIDEAKLDFIRFIKESGVNSFTIGRVSVATPSERENAEVYREVARSLLKKFTVVNSSNASSGRFIPPIPISYRDKGSDFGGDFISIASGSVNNAYLHKGTGMVYKVPNEFLERIGIGESMKSNFMVKENYEKINQKKLSDDFKVDYAKTYFFSIDDGSGREIVIQAQEYLDPENYEDCNLDWDLEKKITKEFDGLLSDFHSGNVRRHKESGRIILIDCIVG